MKLKLRIVQILAFVCGLVAWSYGFSQKHQMPITQAGSAYVDKLGSPCSEQDYRRGNIAVRVFIGSWVVGVFSTIGVALLKKSDSGV